LNAPRGLNAPMRWKFSHLKNSRNEGLRGVAPCASPLIVLLCSRLDCDVELEDGSDEDAIRSNVLQVINGVR
jgi:hypothetical protein